VVRFIFILFVCLAGCGAASFNYRNYGLAPESYEGKLLGPEAKDDIPLSQCKPDEVVKGKCVVMFTDEFFRLKADLLATQKALIDCQRNGN